MAHMGMTDHDRHRLERLDPTRELEQGQVVALARTHSNEEMIATLHKHRVFDPFQVDTLDRRTITVRIGEQVNGSTRAVLLDEKNRRVDPDQVCGHSLARKILESNAQWRLFSSTQPMLA